jgi:hypothetical protein
MPGYFQYFPLVRYANTYARNITSRVAITEETLKERYNFYPYELKTETRPDLLAHYYYDSSFYDWTLFATNTIIDPYYQWYLNDENLTKLTENKYGSLVSATSKIHHWEVNWLGDDSTLTQNQYNALTVNPLTGVNQKKYWVPISNDSNIGYKRKRLEYTVKTNKIIEFNPTFTSGNSFNTDEKVFQTSGSVISAYGFVQHSNSSVILLNNINGTFSNSSPLVGEDSGSSATFTYSNTIATSIPESEISYWSSVSNYDYEIIENEKRRSINVVNNIHIDDVQNTFESIISNE